MNLVQTPIDGLLLVETDIRKDERGEFSRLFCERELAACVGSRRIVQLNRSVTRVPGTVRGMHYQHPPSAETKMVRCLRGRVFDVAVDLRRGSPTFLRWSGHELSGASANMLVIPEGFAHGFQAIEPDSELLYAHTAFYDSAREGGLSPVDPMLSIRWPLPVAGLSERDRSHPALTTEFRGIPL